jgi:hypothetical protein
LQIVLLVPGFGHQRDIEGKDIKARNDKDEEKECTYACWLMPRNEFLVIGGAEAE